MVGLPRRAVMLGASDPTPLLLAWMEPLLAEFTAPTARHALVLLTGALLAPARRTVAAALRAAGYGQAADFTNYHRVLNRNRWSPRHIARRLLLLLVQAFAPEGPVVIGLDDTLERRWGAKIKARGIYRDPVRSSHGHWKPRNLRAVVMDGILRRVMAGVPILPGHAIPLNATE